MHLPVDQNGFASARYDGAVRIVQEVLLLLLLLLLLLHLRRPPNGVAVGTDL